MVDRETAISILDEILDERENQDRQWGGPEHDDKHTPLDWCVFIERQMRIATNAEAMAPWIDRRERFLKIAALALAAVESGDRVLGLP
jgi:hypothetical protein